MEAESEGDIPTWAFSPAKYFTPSDAEVEPKALDEVMSNNVIWLRIGIISAMVPGPVLFKVKQISRKKEQMHGFYIQIKNILTNFPQKKFLILILNF